MAFRKITSVVLASAVVLGMAGCSLTKINFDIDSLDDVNGNKVMDALDEIGVDDSDIVIYNDDSFNFTSEPSKYYDVNYDIDATTSITYYSYAECVDAETAQELFDYYYEGTYSDILENNGGTFTGRKGVQIEDGASYIILDGEFETDSSYSVYHDIVVLKDNVVFIAWIDVSSESEVADAKKEVDSFLDALGLKVF